jgi:riboflavin synthase
MFTGLIADLGRVAELDTDADGARLRIATSLAGDVREGDSIAVNGVCLTATEVDAEGFSTEAMPETLARSSLGALDEGDAVNLELALRAADRLGGHVVQGHVDGTGVVLSRTPGEAWESVRFGLPSELSRFVAEKGSVAVDGVSLTVTAVGPDWFEVGLIPETLRATDLGHKAPGDPVNIETDVLAKYLDRLLEQGGANR